MGNGRSSRSLSRAGIRRSPFRGLPDSRRHSPRQAEFRPRGRAVQRLSITEFQVRLFSSLQLVVAATGLRTRSRHACDTFSRLNRLAPGQPPLLTARSPEATGLASSLIDCFCSQSSGAVCNIAGLRKFLHVACPAIVTFPSRTLSLSAFRRFSFGEPNFLFLGPARAARNVLIRSSNQSLSGNCDSLRLETCLNYLDSTWNGF
jgi:hypothetical protein